MKERLLKFLEEENLTAAKFADEIGVQRSSISHILSGRNNPGYDFIQKILKRFPQLNAEWLLLGSGKMAKEPLQASLFNQIPEEITILSEKRTEKEPGRIFSPSQDKSAKDEKGVGVDSKFIYSQQEGKEVEKIVILYSDRSFKEYVPAK
jgi:transcriptional regulator with XRE-family HTH domain